MCYFLHGAVNRGIHNGDYQKVIHGTDYHFNIGTAADVNQFVESDRACQMDYRITERLCDCGTPIGGGHANRKGLAEFAALLRDMRQIRGIQYVLLSKNWDGDKNECAHTVHINDIDLLYFLANVKDNCLYTIQLFQKYD